MRSTSSRLASVPPIEMARSPVQWISAKVATETATQTSSASTTLRTRKRIIGAAWTPLLLPPRHVEQRIAVDRRREIEIAAIGVVGDVGHQRHDRGFARELLEAEAVEAFALGPVDDRAGLLEPRHHLGIAREIALVALEEQRHQRGHVVDAVGGP